jgi:hypothetical protein
MANRRFRGLLCALSLPGAAACATTGATFGSGVGDARFESPPYYAGARVSGAPRVVHLPIGYQRGAAQSPIFDPTATRGTATAALLADMNAYLDSLAVTTRVDPAAGAAPGTPPDVHFGCARHPGDEECEEARSTSSDPPLRLAVGQPSRAWIEWAAAAADRAQASSVLVITLEVGQYWVRQKGRFGGRKVVELGTEHSQPVPWLTSLDTPAQVLQLTGALIDRDGSAIRIGAEGLFARRTGVLVTSIGAQELLTDEDVQRVRTTRRDELPGRPLVWQAALRKLVAELTGRPEVAPW